MDRWGKDIDRDDDRQSRQGHSPAMSRSAEYPSFDRKDFHPREHLLGNTPQETSLQRERIVFRDREYRVRSTELAVLAEVGRFRVVPFDDLRRELYTGRQDTLRQEAQSLERQGLAKRVAAPSRPGQYGLTMLMLTPQGRGLIEQELRRRGADLREISVYAGGVNPRELFHDAMLYRMYNKEARRIEQSGGSVRAAQLDPELKAKTWSGLARLRREQPTWSEAKLRGTIADEHQLPIIKGHIVFPDVRVVYVDARGDLGRVDLELATCNYRSSHIATKLQAGFTLYLAGGSSGPGRGSFDDHLAMERLLTL